MTSQHSTAAATIARERAGLIDRSDLGRIVVSGRDRASYLNGLLTNDIASLKAGEGCYAAYLTAQGRMIADMFVYELGDVILLTMTRDVKDTVLAKLDQFVFSEDVQLGDVTDRFAHVAVVGRDAAAIVAAILGRSVSELAALPAHGNCRARFAERPAIVIRVTDTGEPGFDLLVEAAVEPQLRAALKAAGVDDLDPATVEMLRVEAGVPKFHRDMDEETIPLEAGIEATAISMTKGCYVGQEVIIRVLHRGHGRVVKHLVGLTAEGSEVPAAGIPIEKDGRDIGKVTSAVFSSTLGKPIALGYVHRDFTEPGTQVTIGGTEAVVTALPFVRPSAL
jgi:folate-binding protein YgfZ